MKEVKLYNPSGSLTAYALACGLVEKASFPEHKVELFMEHDHYHVKLVAAQPYIDVQVWEVFERLTDARQLFNKLVNRVK